MHKFFVEKKEIYNGYAYIKGDDVKHLYKVLRLEVGDKISINNMAGEEFYGVIDDISKSEVLVKITEKLDFNNESSLKLYLYQGVPKSAKMDIIVQKATELGLKAIKPVITERVVVKSELGEFKKTDRWNRIALEACKQSKRSEIPEVCAPIEFEELLSEIKNYDLIVVPYENAEEYGLKTLIREIDNKKITSACIIIGPEGGFETNEIEALKASGAYIVTLGPRIFRTETAGLVAASILMYELGDIGGK